MKAKTPFTITCPSCKNKQTGYIEHVNFPFGLDGWRCVVKNCNCFLYSSELTEHLQLTVSDFK